MEKVWRVLLVDDDEEICEQIKEFVDDVFQLEDGDMLDLTIVNDFLSATKTLEKIRFDIIILDVLGNTEGGSPENFGSGIYNEIKKICFLPIIFYTGVPNYVSELEGPGVMVINKTKGVVEIGERIKDVINSGLPSVNRLLYEHVQYIHRDYMWGFLMGEWNKYYALPNKDELAYFLARRLAHSFSSFGITELAVGISNNSEYSAEFDVYNSDYQVSPLHYYLTPPVEKITISGDIYKGDVMGENGYWVVLTPSCDFRNKELSYILLATCILLENHEDYCDSTASNTKKQNFLRLLGNRKGDRNFFLPAFLEHPDMVVDLQNLKCVKTEDFNRLDRIASLDSTFASELISRFIRQYARRGTPDLNVENIQKRVEERLMVKKEVTS